MAGQLSIDLKHTTVLFMDYQNRQMNFFSKEFQDDLSRRANEVLGKVREVHIPLIYIQHIPGERILDTEFYPATAPKTGDMVIIKTRNGPFVSTNLDEVLKKQGSETLVLMGIQGSGCVLATVQIAWDMGYKLIVISDCCPDKDSEVHRVLMEKIFPPRRAMVVTSQQFLLMLKEA